MKNKKIIIFVAVALCVVVLIFAAFQREKLSRADPKGESVDMPSSELEESESQELVLARGQAIEQAKVYAKQYDYDRALELLSDPSIQNSEVSAVVAEVEAKKDSLVLYQGDIKHIFFHSLIIYPEMIFKDKSKPMGGYNAGFSEKAELEKILPQLYQRGYVLYDLAQCFELKDGKMMRKEIWLPPGKQPLILSVDDVAYAYGDGYAQKLMVNDNGLLVNLVKDPQGNIQEMPDGDVFGVVDAFVKKYPDFSYKGHKGTLAMTGYQGAFGFSFDTPADQEEIRKVVSALRADGWNFASHSYTHNSKNFFGPESKPENIEYDTNKWLENVAPYFGPTNLFIAPFGFRVEEPGLQHILDAGFQIYCTVGNKIINEVYVDYALMSRIEIGGYSMTYLKDVLNNNFFNVDEVFDAESRPPVIG